MTKEVNINNLTLEDSKSLLKEVKLYRDLKKQLGSRGVNLYNKIKTGKKNLVVEYFPSMSQDLAWEEANKVFTKVFSLNVKKEDVIFVEKESILGGIRVYSDDSVVDLSYLKIERIVKK
ncbi:MAG: hypothetical protein PHI37_03080 [Candidatus Gracilibacteria bacterium]|nr:hypothetical protein [Candidatus Gracilibacteria bacterium]